MWYFLNMMLQRDPFPLLSLLVLWQTFASASIRMPRSPIAVMIVFHHVILAYFDVNALAGIFVVE